MNDVAADDDEDDVDDGTSINKSEVDANAFNLRNQINKDQIIMRKTHHRCVPEAKTNEQKVW